MVNYLALGIALILSICSAYYSVMGLAAIFASAPIPIIIMGSTLEAAKVIAISWLYRNWKTAPKPVKYYLLSAVSVLMLITSMGTYGYLSKAHSDHSLINGVSQSKVALYDEKISALKAEVDAKRRTLKQMDDAVDQVMARSEDEKGADKAYNMRRSQQKERARLLDEIGDSQQKIGTLNEERAPYAAELRKVQSEVGPLQYIAKLFYGPNPDTDTLDKAVMLVIVLIVIVFDPLAVVLLIAANHGIYGHEKVVTLKPKRQPKTTKIATPSWIKKTSELIERRKRGTIEIDKNTVMKMK